MRLRDDDGITLVEVMAAMVVMALFATGILAALVTTIRAQRTDNARVNAAQIASKYIELARGQGAAGIAWGTSVPGTVPSGYSIVQNAEAVTVNATASACATGGKLSYVRVTETVSWTGMSPGAAVKEDTLLALPITDPTKASLAVPVQDAAGSPVAGATVTLSPTGGSQVTTSAGCAAFTGLTPGTYVASVTEGGYVDQRGNPTATSTTSLGSGAATIASPVLYAPAGALSLSYSPPAGAGVVPDSLPLTVQGGSTSYPARVFLACGTAGATAGYCASAGQAPRLVGSPSNSDPQRLGLFPTGTTPPYAVYAGDCSDNAPTNTASVAVPAAGWGSVALPLAAVNVTVSNASAPVAGAVVQAVHTAGYGCPTTTTIQLGTTSAAGSVLTALPRGHWDIQVVGATAAPSWPSVQLSSGNTTSAAVVLQ